MRPFGTCRFGPTGRRDWSMSETEVTYSSAVKFVWPADSESFPAETDRQGSLKAAQAALDAERRATLEVCVCRESLEGWEP